MYVCAIDQLLFHDNFKRIYISKPDIPHRKLILAAKCKWYDYTQTKGCFLFLVAVPYTTGLYLFNLIELIDTFYCTTVYTDCRSLGGGGGATCTQFDPEK